MILDIHLSFQIWDDPKIVPHFFLQKSFVKLNFKLHIYFNCRKVAEGLESVSECLQNIRTFFDCEGGSDLSGDQEFIPYFALPFVANPQSHPTFEHLFQPPAWRDLRNDVVNYVLDLRAGFYDSALVSLICSSGTEFLVTKEQETETLRKKYMNLIERHNALRKDHHKLIGWSYGD